MNAVTNADRASISTFAAPRCSMCGVEGRRIRVGIRDSWLGVRGDWTHRACPRCDAIWLDPQPRAEEIPRLYQGDYYTHAACSEEPIRTGAVIRFAKRAFSAEEGPRQTGWIRSRASVRGVAEGSLMWLGDTKPGRLLDIGCGSGMFLDRMRNRGWSVTGVEPDPRAAELAGSNGLDVRCSGIEDATFPEESFDAITMSHVIEHVSDPLETFKVCRKLLTRNGVLVVVTPNSKSLGRRWFGNDWLGWDVPRHLRVFAPENLAACAQRAGLVVDQMDTTARSCFAMLPSMTVLARASHTARSRGSLRIAALAFWMIEHLASRSAPRGEEILLIARRSS